MVQESRNLLRLIGKQIIIIIAGVAAALLVACGAAAPESTTAPPQAATSAPPQAATAAPPPTFGFAATPAPPVAAPTTAPAMVEPAKDTLVVVYDEEIDTGNVLLQGSGDPAMLSHNFAEPVTVVSRATLKDETMSGFTGWEEISPSVWRLTLRDGVKFHNGESWTPEGAKYILDYYGNNTDGARNGQFIGPTTTEILDDKTIEVTCEIGCPLFPRYASYMNFTAWEWYQNASEDERASTIIGFGPLKTVEYRKGQWYKGERYEDYVPAPGIPEASVSTMREVTWLSRAEPAVRLAMLQTGEADIAWYLDVADVDKMPAHVLASEGAVIQARIDTIWNPTLADKKVRQALALAINCEAMAQTFYQGRNQCVGVPATLGVLGVTEENVKPLPYDPVRAKELLAESGYAGEEIRLRTKEGVFPEVESAEAVVNFWNEVGFNANLVVMESSKWSDYNSTGAGRYPKEDWHRLSELPPPEPALVSPDIIWGGVPNDSLDYGRNIGRYMSCIGTLSHSCDPERFQPMVEAALAAGGEERGRLLAEVLEVNREEVYIIPTFPRLFAVGFHQDLDFTMTPGDRRFHVSAIHWKK